MDANGCDWCEHSFEYLVDQMMRNASQLISTRLITEAVFRSSVGKALARNVIRRLLRSAIDDARDEAIQNFQAKQENAIPIWPKGPKPFNQKPRLTLMFHVWPQGDRWRKHLEYLSPVLDRFDRKMMGIAVDNTTCTADEVKEVFGDTWEYTVVQNKPHSKGKHGLREVATYMKMMPKLWKEDHDVTFCAHGKGAQKHTEGSSAIEWWTEAMYETVIWNIDDVLRRMEEGKAIVGSFRRHGRHLGVRFRYHFSGTFYAFRNAAAFSSGIPQYRQVWFGTESWPGDYFSLPLSDCIFGDNIGNLYDVTQQPRKELELWRGTVSPGD